MNPTKTILKKGLAISFMFVLLIFCFTLVAHHLIRQKASALVYNSVTEIPHNKVGLLLGTSKYVAKGKLNLYYKHRIEAAHSLFTSGKIDYILVSGDNSTDYYNEPKKFKADLISIGIPENRIILDYAGFRTLDSVVRAKQVFGESAITIISQRFHNERALFIACNYNMQAIAFNAQDVSIKYGLRVQIREYLARVKVFIDILFNVQPKFLGDPIPIPNIVSVETKASKISAIE